MKRALAQEVPLDQLWESAEPIDYRAKDPATELAPLEETLWLAGLLRRLHRADREIIRERWNRKKNGENMAKVAAVLGITPAAAYKRLQWAFAALFGQAEWSDVLLVPQEFFGRLAADQCVPLAAHLPC